MGATPEPLADGLWRWSARHPEWHPGEFGREVACFAFAIDGQALLVDPLLPPEPEPVWDLFERIAGDRVDVLITIPYHVRSSEEVRDRLGAHVPLTIWGHPACRKRLADGAGFRTFEPGDELPAGVTAHRIGRPRRFETPLHVPSHDAVVFGDAVAEVDGRLRVWAERRVDDDVIRFYRERFNPTLEPLVDLEPERILVTHGQPVLERGAAALRAALKAKPWYHRG
jgi:hypothetical protein